MSIHDGKAVHLSYWNTPETGGKIFLIDVYTTTPKWLRYRSSSLGSEGQLLSDISITVPSS